MRLISLELKNIRSYREAKVEFLQGITLLSGDIGAGKSTILLAIEFALFGISRSDLTGLALLRHGASNGAVSVSFMIGDKTYSIRRTLKRQSGNVLQDNGWLDSENGREALTPNELRAKTFELLGYPLQFLSKQKNLLYRFTLYTPQEEMKAILSQSEEERLEIIRRIFGVETYRAARDNSQLVAKAIKERSQTKEILLTRLKIEQERYRQRLTREPAMTEERRIVSDEKERLKVKMISAEKILATMEKEHSDINDLQRAQAISERTRGVIDQELQMMRSDLARKQKQKDESESTIAQIMMMLSKIGEQKPTGDAEKEIDLLQSQLEQSKQEEGKVRAIIAQCHAPDIAAGAKCPLCKQLVTQEYASDLAHTLHAQSSAGQKKLDVLLKRQDGMRASIRALQELLSKSRQCADFSARLQEQKKQLSRFIEDLKFIEDAITAKQKQRADLPGMDNTLAEKARLAGQRLLDAKRNVQETNSHIIEVERRLSRIEQEEKDLKEIKTQLEIAVTEEKATIEDLARENMMRSWLSQRFAPFASTVERHVFAAIHSSFDAAFREWFAKLVEDDSLSARVDHSFSPLLVQHGYETSADFLSGGERTAVSLAYRLALVHTIHLLLPRLGTAGLIILDEPTDGFSSEQLERVRDVLRELSMEQIILVSHEQMLEGFVDHILRVRKTGDGSIIEIV